MFLITYQKTGKSIEVPNKVMWLLLDQLDLEELEWGKDDLWFNEVI